MTTDCSTCKDVDPEANTFPAVALPKESHQLRKCPSCGALFRYNYHYEYLATSPSEDEYYLWRLTPEAHAVIEPILSGTMPRDEGLSWALRHENDEIREHAALLFWDRAQAGETLPEAMKGMAEMFGRRGGSNALPNFLYRGLVVYGQKSAERARAVKAALQEAAAVAKDSLNYASGVVREMNKVPGVASS
jgi:hypothetical protein